MFPQLKTRQVCFFIIAFVPVTKLFIMSSVLAGFAKEDMWISALFNVLIDLITLAFVLKACRNAKTDFITLLEDNLGKTGKNVVLAIYFFYFLLKGIVPINEQKDYVEMTLYMTQPNLLTFLPVLICSFYLCLKELRTIGRISDITWLITIVGFVLLLSLSVANADFSAILPIGANGINNVLKGSFSVLNWFGDIPYIMFFIGKFKYEKNSTGKILLSYAIAGVMVIFFTIIFYGVFTSIAFRQQFALTEISKYSTVINSIGRFDYIAILMLLFSNVFALSLPIYFASKMLQGIFPIKQRWIFPLVLTVIYASVLMFLSEYFYSIEKFISTFGNAYFLILGNVLPCFTVLLKNKENKLYAVPSR